MIILPNLFMPAKCLHAYWRYEETSSSRRKIIPERFSDRSQLINILCLNEQLVLFFWNFSVNNIKIAVEKEF